MTINQRGFVSSELSVLLALGHPAVIGSRIAETMAEGDAVQTGPGARTEEFKHARIGHDDPAALLRHDPGGGQRQRVKR